MPRWFLPAAAAALAVAVSALGIWPTAAENAKVVPAPAADVPPGQASEVAVLAGGCFWGVQGVYQHLKGVKNVLSGFSGGSRGTAEYETVSGGDTGHAESVEIEFDEIRCRYKLPRKDSRRRSDGCSRQSGR